MKCLVLGGAGYLGTQLCYSLLEQKHDVLVYDKLSCLDDKIHGFNNHITYIQGDLKNYKILEKAVQKSEIVFHLATNTTPVCLPLLSQRRIDDELIPTVKLLDIMVRYNIRKFIFASSGGAVYGRSNNKTITEDHTTNPISLYGIIKLTIEKYIHLYHHIYGLDYCILRISNPYGKNKLKTNSKGVIPTFFKNILNDKNIEVWGDGSIIKDYIYIDDVISAFIKTLEYNGDTKLFNIASNSGTSIIDLLRKIESITEKKANISYLPQRVFDTKQTILNIDRARDLLNWEPATNIDNGLLKLKVFIDELK